jgi:hypothetical protein
MAARIGTPSPNLKPYGVVSARKHVAGASSNASKVKLSTQLVSSAQSEMQLGLRVRLLAGKRVLIASDAKPSRRRAELGCVTSASGDNEGAGVLDSDSRISAYEFRSAELGDREDRIAGTVCVVGSHWRVDLTETWRALL